ncbi:MAG: peptide chain release factor N(5)-glutamine methyltransferase [Parachlamydiales bacterium]
MRPREVFGDRLAEELLAAALGIKRVELYLYPDRLVTPSEKGQFEATIARAKRGEPPAYILGEVEFYNVTLSVDKRVLIPRPETELMVEEIVNHLKGKKGLLWDLCTGSGCIALALKKALPNLTVVGSDLSEEALDLARYNAARNGLDVPFYKGNFLDAISKPVDYLVTNPPYVTEEEYRQLTLLHWEPRVALVGGLTFYERLAQELPAKVKPGGQVWMEIGADQGEAVCALFSSPHYQNLSCTQDLAGHDRVISLELAG